ncbi:hypothetical protein MOX02_30020 [Methylobacterium oxalidis]|uniref:Uncharacterized protein n=1 Tax=Methylobacterium oxalidis TaxID=944322 RepID=A0A512J4T2_9HYPH|nr:hypothetical protein MOX02_30020 [Methylobacterium oxalidis]GLS63701.1 hypothetical protein GCM10007888_20820 [Methylobacterium oxalidis]
MAVSRVKGGSGGRVSDMDRLVWLTDRNCVYRSVKNAFGGVKARLPPLRYGREPATDRFR